MQYILTEEEYKSLLDKKSESVRLSEEKLQKLCTKIANEMPIKMGRHPDQPWGCILTDEYHEYCDECPVTEICPNQFKHWSK
jgi:hypothetical protein